MQRLSSNSQSQKGQVASPPSRHKEPVVACGEYAAYRQTVAHSDVLQILYWELLKRESSVHA